MAGVVANRHVASSSAISSAAGWQYDVFLSFRGPDTRRGITSELYDQLHNKRGITTFMDDPDLEVGDAISPTLLKAIEESRFAIVVLSPNYASSTWCLEELAKICECMKDNNRIFPLFYNVEPSDVRYQKKRSFEEAFNKHESSGRHEGKLKQWKDALNKVASFKGWTTEKHKTDRDLVDTIVEEVYSKVQPREMEFTMSNGDFQEFEATRITRNEIMDALQDDEVTAIGVHGMGGVGKTTMVKHVAEQSLKNGTFHHVIMAVVSQIPNFKNIQETLLEELLGSKVRLPENLTESGRASRLRENILKKKNILIILDDIWKFTDLSKIGIPSYDKLKRCHSKVLLTTRRRHVCHEMGCQKTITLQILSTEDSWTLFVWKTRRIFESTELEDVARRVAGECKGLPIALITVARALGDQDPAEWKKAAERLEKSQSANPHHEDEDDTFECIKLSYDYLKNEYKSFFLLCCLFPEDHEIDREVLFRYAIGKGLFRDAETISKARGRADTLVKYLIDSSLLLKGPGMNCVAMHDVVRDTALNIAKSEDGHWFLVKARCGLHEWSRQLLLPEGCTAISVMENRIRKLPPQMVCPKLQILSLNCNRGLNIIPETFLLGLNNLRVLDVSFTDISLLPKSFGSLTNLRVLNLSYCGKLRDISMVGKLGKLEILSMRGTQLWELSGEIGNLANLRVLDITYGKMVRIPPKLISRLHSLEELYLDCGFKNWGSNTNAGFDEVTGLSNLRALKVRISDAECIPKLVEFNPNWIDFSISIGKNEDIDVFSRNGKINLNLDSISKFPDWLFNLVMNEVEKLHWKCPQTSLTDFFVEYERGRLKGLNSLKHLTVWCEGLGGGVINPSTWVPNVPVFQNLEKLTLWRMGISGFEFLALGSLANLKSLDVTSCHCYNRGNVLLPSTLLQRLRNLEELECNYVIGIEFMFGCEALSKTEELKLRKIELKGVCPDNIRSICKGPAPPAIFQNLQSFSFTCCGLQGSLFTDDVAQNLSQLNILILRGCPFLERIFKASSKKIILPKLKQLSLIDLPVLYYESASFNIECPSLEELIVWGCPKFSVSVPADFHSTKQVKYHRVEEFILTEELKQFERELKQWALMH